MLGEGRGLPSITQEGLGTTPTSTEPGSAWWMVQFSEPATPTAGNLAVLWELEVLGIKPVVSICQACFL